VETAFGNTGRHGLRIAQHWKKYSKHNLKNMINKNWLDKKLLFAQFIEQSSVTKLTLKNTGRHVIDQRSFLG